MEYKLSFVLIPYFKFAQFLRQIQFDSAGDFLLLNHDFGFHGLAIDKLLCQSSVLLLNQIQIETLYGIAVSSKIDTCLLRVNWFYCSLINISLFKEFKNEYLCLLFVSPIRVFLCYASIYTFQRQFSCCLVCSIQPPTHLRMLLLLLPLTFQLVSKQVCWI